MAATPEQIAKEWSTRLAASTAKIQAGVQAVNVAPGQAAAKQKAVWLANIQANQDKWARNVASVSLQSWQNDFINKGLPRIATGATAAEPKFAQFMGALMPYIESGVKQLPARGNLESNINRMVAWVRHMSNFKKPPMG
jgi:hypothetical protein